MQYQYPGGFAAETPYCIKDATQIPHFTDQNHYLYFLMNVNGAFNECQWSIEICDGEKCKAVLLTLKNAPPIRRVSDITVAPSSFQPPD